MQLYLQVSKLEVNIFLPSDETSADIWIGHKSIYFFALHSSFRGVSRASNPYATATFNRYIKVKSSNAVIYSVGDIISSVRIASVGKKPSIKRADVSPRRRVEVPP